MMPVFEFSESGNDSIEFYDKHSVISNFLQIFENLKRHLFGGVEHINWGCRNSHPG